LVSYVLSILLCIQMYYCFSNIESHGIGARAVLVAVAFV